MLFLFLISSMLESGALPSSTWSHNMILLVFLMIYNIIIFMSMLNFIIAIIIDAYMKVVQKAKLNESEQVLYPTLPYPTLLYPTLP